MGMFSHQLSQHQAHHPWIISILSSTHHQQNCWEQLQLKGDCKQTQTYPTFFWTWDVDYRWIEYFHAWKVITQDLKTLSRMILFWLLVKLFFTLKLEHVFSKVFLLENLVDAANPRAALAEMGLNILEGFLERIISKCEWTFLAVPPGDLDGVAPSRSETIPPSVRNQGVWSTSETIRTSP